MILDFLEKDFSAGQSFCIGLALKKLKTIFWIKTFEGQQFAGRKMITLQEYLNNFWFEDYLDYGSINRDLRPSFCIGDYVRKKKNLRSREFYIIKGIVKRKNCVRYQIETFFGQDRGEQIAENLVRLCRPFFCE